MTNQLVGQRRLLRPDGKFPRSLTGLSTIAIPALANLTSWRMIGLTAFTR